MSDDPKLVSFETDMYEGTYDLESEEKRPLMLEKIAKNIAKFGSLEGWLLVFRQELEQKRMAANNAVMLYWTNRKQLEFIERFALEGKTAELPGIDPLTLHPTDPESVRPA